MRLTITVLEAHSTWQKETLTTTTTVILKKRRTPNLTANEFNNSAYNNGISSIGIRSATLVQLHKMGFKQVPLSADNKVVMSWTPIYENSNYWTAERLANPEEHFKFVNVATVFGKTHIKDEYGLDLYLNCFDCDSEYVYKVLTTAVEQLSWIYPILKSKIQNLIAKTGDGNVKCLLDYLKMITSVVKTKKSYGVHVYWLSHKQNNRIRTEDCKPGYEFEIKTDKGSGHATLPPSTHRHDKNFRYYDVGRTDKIDTNDELYDIILELFAKDCLIKKEGHDSKDENKRRASAIAITPYYQINPIILGQDQIIDSVNKLIDCYRERHRDPFTFEFSGLAFKQGIAEESATAIIEQLSIKTNDPEKNSRLNVVHQTYVNGVNGSDLSGSSGLKKVIASIQGYNEEQQANQIIKSLINIWYRHGIPLSSLTLNKISYLTDEHLDKIKITSADIEYCVDTILKETPNEQIPVRQLFVGLCSSSTHLPQNIGIRTQAGAGKNYMINKVISKFPQKNIITLSNMTPKALFHEHETRVVKNPETGEYESLDSLIDKIDEEIENKQDEIANTKEKEKIKELKKDIKNLEEEKKSLTARVVKLIDLDSKVLVFLDTPNYNLLTNIAPILSHDKYEQEYRFVDSGSSGPLKTKVNVIRGFPTVIFAQASDSSNRERYAEINRRYLSVSVNTSEKKVEDAVALKVERAGGARGEYDLKIVDKAAVYRTKVILAILMRKLEKSSRPYKQQLIEDRTLKLDDIDSGIFIPFKETLKVGLPHKRILDMTAAETFNIYLTLLAKINADSRPKLIYSDGIVIPIATFEDLAAAMSLLQFSNTGLSPELQQWFEDVFLPVYNDKEKEQKEREKQDGKSEGIQVSITTGDLIEKHKELSSKKGAGESRAGYGEANSKEILQKYLYPLINLGYIEDERVEGRKAKLYLPIKDLKYSFYSFPEEKNIFPYQFKMKVEKSELFPSKDILELQISDSLKCSSKYAERQRINIKLVDVDDNEITVKELVEKYFSNPERYFFKNRENDEGKEHNINIGNISQEKEAAEKSYSYEKQIAANNIITQKEKSEEYFSNTENDSKSQQIAANKVKSIQATNETIEENVLLPKKEQIEYSPPSNPVPSTESRSNVPKNTMPSLPLSSSEDESKENLEYHYGNDDGDAEEENYEE